MLFEIFFRIKREEPVHLGIPSTVRGPLNFAVPCGFVSHRAAVLVGIIVGGCHPYDSPPTHEHGRATSMLTQRPCLRKGGFVYRDKFHPSRRQTEILLPCHSFPSETTIFSTHEATAKYRFQKFDSINGHFRRFISHLCPLTPETFIRAFSQYSIWGCSVSDCPLGGYEWKQIRALKSHLRTVLLIQSASANKQTQRSPWRTIQPQIESISTFSSSAASYSISSSAIQPLLLSKPNWSTDFYSLRWLVVITKINAGCLRRELDTVHEQEHVDAMNMLTSSVVNMMEEAPSEAFQRNGPENLLQHLFLSVPILPVGHFALCSIC